MNRAAAYLAILSFVATPTFAQLSIQTAHPRLLFDADSMAVIRGRFGPGGTYRDVWLDYMSWVDNYMNSSSIYLTHHQAMVWLIEQDTRYADRAILTTMTEAAAGHGLQGEGQGPDRIGLAAITYDWCYDRLTADQRAYLRRKIYERIGAWDYSSYMNQPKDRDWCYRLAVAGDYSTPDSNAAIVARFEDSVDLWENGYAACFDTLAKEGGWDGYGVKIYHMLVFREAMRSATNYSGPGLTSAFYANFPQYYFHRLNSQGDPLRSPAKYNVNQPSSMAAMLASCYDVPQGHTMLAYYMDASSWSWEEEGATLFPWYNPAITAAPLTSLPLDYAAHQMGQYFMRTGWTIGLASSDILVTYFNSPNTDYGQGQAQGHFTVSRGQDNLLIDSGRYRGDTDEGFEFWYAATIPHNVLLINDPAEPYGTFTNGWGHQFNRPNDGGQERFDMTCGGTGNLWPACSLELGGGPIVECRGSNVYSFTDAYSIIESDITSSYYDPKVDQVIRRFMYIKPNWIFIQDFIDLGKPSLETRAVFHCVPRPTVNGSLTALVGNLNTGGVYQSTDSDIITIDQGTSQARIYVLPQTGGASDKIRLVGGPNPAGLYWKQNHEPMDTYSYVSSINDISYEFYYGGDNWPPGGYDCSSLRDGRNAAGPNQCGDWRVEHLIEGAPDLLDTAYLIHVTADTDPVASVYAERIGDDISITINDDGDVSQIYACRPGTLCDMPVTYTTLSRKRAPYIRGE